MLDAQLVCRIGSRLCFRLETWFRIRRVRRQKQPTVARLSVDCEHSAHGVGQTGEVVEIGILVKAIGGEIQNRARVKQKYSVGECLGCTLPALAKDRAVSLRRQSTTD